MSEMARAARAAMKNKIQRLTAGEPKAKVDASTWSPPEMMNTEAKTGMRPISRRAFRKGGKVIEKCEGSEAMKRADRKQRKSGGRSLVTDLINRNDKKANLARDGGGAHVGGYKRGGDVEQDKKLIKKALAQHDKHMHGGKHEEIKLKKGGSANWIAGAIKHPGALHKSLKVPAGEKIPAKKLVKAAHSDNPKLAKRARLAQTLKRLHKADAGSVTQDPRKAIPGDAPTRGPDPMGRPSRATGPRYENIDELIRDQKLDRKRGGKAGGTYFGGTRPTGGRMPKAKGGDVNPGYNKEAVDKEIRKDKRIKGKEAQQIHRLLRGRYDDHTYQERTPVNESRYMDRGDSDYPDDYKKGGRTQRKAGGRTKGKTNINIIVNPGKPQDQQQAMMPKMPTPSPLPIPPIAPPPMPMGAGAPPMPLPPGPPPAGLAGGAPGAMPPLPRKAGGRAYRSYKDMDAGALSGMGRLEKTEIEHGKRVRRLSGGRARSYKDMDAGALSGMGRIEKTAIQKHKR